VAARLLITARGDTSKAQEYLAELESQPAGQTETLENASLTGYSPTTIVRLQRRGVSHQDFWYLGKARIPEPMVDRLLDSGLKTSDINHAAERGYSPEEMSDLVPALEAFNAALGTERLNLYGVIDATVPPAELRAVDPADFTQEERRVIEVTGVRPNPNPPPGRLMPTIVDDYLRRGVTAGFASWFLMGIVPFAAGEFHRARVEPEVANSWLKNGFTPSEAVAYLGAGSDLAVEVARRARTPWTAYFRRSSRGVGWYALRRRADFTRFYHAAHSLAVPHWVWAAMFSDRTEDWRFLDGGISIIDRYGFFGPNGSWVVGRLALQLMCSRLGLEPPRRLDDAKAVDPGQLETMLEEQRLREWRSLEDRALP